MTLLEIGLCIVCVVLIALWACERMRANGLADDLAVTRDNYTRLWNGCLDYRGKKAGQWQGQDLLATDEQEQE